MLEVLDEACTPTRGSKYSACIDLKSREDVIIGAGETVLIPLGVKIDLEQLKGTYLDSLSFEESISICEEIWEINKSSHYLQLMLRSSLSKELIIANGVGVIDMDYEGEIMIRVHNPVTIKDVLSLSFYAIKKFLYEALGNKEFQKYSYSACKVKKGQRVCQIILLEHKSYLFGVESEKERVGGFGSTGV